MTTTWTIKMATTSSNDYDGDNLDDYDLELRKGRLYD